MRDSFRNLPYIPFIMISDVRKLELCKKAQHILVDLPQAVKGNQSLAQEIANRIEVIAKTPHEYAYLVDVVSELVRQSKGKEIKIFYKGKELTRENLVKDHGVFLAPDNKTIFGDHNKKDK